MRNAETKLNRTNVAPRKSEPKKFNKKISRRPESAGILHIIFETVRIA